MIPKIFLSKDAQHQPDGISDYEKAKRYENKQAKPANKEHALTHYRLAAEKGIVDAYFQMGRLYIEKDAISEALEAYFKASMQGHKEAEDRLLALANGGNMRAQYYVGCVYEQAGKWLEVLKYLGDAVEQHYPPAMYKMGQLYQQDRIESGLKEPVIRKNHFEELQWYRKAAAKGSSAALAALMKQAETNSEACIQLAEMYKSGEGYVVSNIPNVLTYYMMAAGLGSINAAFKLGQLFEYGRKEITRDPKKAFKYYESAAKQRHPEALNACVGIAGILQEPAIYYALAGLYADVERDKRSAIIYYKKAADSGYKEATSRLHAIASQNAMLAYKIGETYEREKEGIQSSHYYALALRGEAREQAKQRLELLASIGYADAQYFLGSEYFHAEGNIAQAIFWCMTAAEQQHSQALQYLTTTAFEGRWYLHIASCYVQGEGVAINLPRAELFYMKAQVSHPREVYFALGQLHEKGGEDFSKNTKKALEFYVMAACKEHVPSIQHLITLATAGNREAQYALGYGYYRTVGNTEEAIKWCMTAAEQQHSQALQYLTSTIFSAAHYLHMASSYKKGRGVSKNLKCAALFYEKAFKLGEKEASFQLGKMAEREENLTPSHTQKVWEYYLHALTHHHPKALSACETLAAKEQGEYLVKLGNIYLHLPGKRVEALHLFKRAADQNLKEADKLLQELACNNADDAYVIAEACRGENKQKTLDFYCMAACLGHVVSLEYLKSLAEQWDKDAQYVLGAGYYHTVGNLGEAVRWCMEAVEQGHEAALHSLLHSSLFDTSIYERIANRYEQGEGVAQNSKRALLFYEKASEKGSKCADFRMGYLYEHAELNVIKAWAHYVTAVKHFHHSEALKACVRIAEALNEKETYYILGELYHHVLKHTDASLIWYKKAEDLGHKEAAKCLNSIARVSEQHAYGIGLLYDEQGSNQKAFSTAFHYYCLAAWKQHPAALKICIGLANELQLKQPAYAVGELYRKVQNDKDEAISWYKKAMALGSKEAKVLLETLANQDAEWAYAIAQSYEAEGNEDRSFSFYVLAMHKDHARARKCLEAYAKTGNAEAQYVLGYEYYHTQHKHQEAIHWCMQAAEQGHTKALAYLQSNSFHTTHYMRMGESYEQGEGVAQDYGKAIHFYEKAKRAGNKVAVLRLGYLYDMEHANQNKEEAYKHYNQALGSGFAEAVSPLKRLQEERQTSVSSSYNTTSTIRTSSSHVSSLRKGMQSAPIPKTVQHK